MPRDSCREECLDSPAPGTISYIVPIHVDLEGDAEYAGLRGVADCLLQSHPDVVVVRRGSTRRA